MPISYPLITYYARPKNNLTGEPLIDFMSMNNNNIWYYGNCNLSGGESEYIIEFDIWNNEPAFDAGTGRGKCPNAKNCKFTVYSKYDQNQNNPYIVKENDIVYNSYIHARCLNNYNLDNGLEFKPIRGGFKNGSIDITGNIDPTNIGTLYGTGDHAIVQTKLVIPDVDQPKLNSGRVEFVFKFSYDYDSEE